MTFLLIAENTALLKEFNSSIDKLTVDMVTLAISNTPFARKVYEIRYLSLQI